MTTREHFAGMAMGAFIAGYRSGKHEWPDAEDIAIYSAAHADALITELARTEPSAHCQWTRDEDGIYSTECDGAWEFTTGTAADNDAKFCPYCGKGITEHHFVDADKMVQPDSDGWIKHDPSGPIPEKHNGVRFGDGEEDLYPKVKWMAWRWNHSQGVKADHITHYKP